MAASQEELNRDAAEHASANMLCIEQEVADEETAKLLHLEENPCFADEEDEKITLVVLGIKGIGKSTLINKVFGEDVAPTSDETEHCTREQTTYPAPKGKDTIFCAAVDTVGMDFKESNFLSTHELQGRLVMFVYLNMDIRIQTSLKDIARRIPGVRPEKINVYNSHFFNAPDSCPFPSWEQFIGDLADGKDLPVVKLPPGRAKQAKEQTKNKAVTGKKKKKTKKSFEQKFPHLVGGTKHIKTRLTLDESEGNLTDLFRKITLQDVKDHREPGDGFLKMMLGRTTLDPADQEQMQSNHLLKLVLFDIMGHDAAKELSGRVYDTFDVGDEKYGDIVEAVLHISFSAELLNFIVGFSTD